MAGQPSGPLSGLLPAQDRTGPDQQVAGVARIPQHQRLHLVGHVHVVVGQREPGQRAGGAPRRRRCRRRAQRAQHSGQRQQLAVRVHGVPVQLEEVPAQRLRPGQDPQRVAHTGDQQGRADLLEQEVVAEGNEKVSTYVLGNIRREWHQTDLAVSEVSLICPEIYSKYTHHV